MFGLFDQRLRESARTGVFLRHRATAPIALLLILLCLFFGATLLAPKAELHVPQSSASFIDISFSFDGASAKKVAALASAPLEYMVSELADVEHVFSASRQGLGRISIQLKTGSQMGPSLARLEDLLASGKVKLPFGVSTPTVLPRPRIDLPVMALTLWSDTLDDSSLRLVALEVRQRLKKLDGIAGLSIIGGRPQQMRIEISLQRLAAYGIAVGQIAKAVQAANVERGIGYKKNHGSALSVSVRTSLQTVGDVENLVVGRINGQPVYLRDVARVMQGSSDASQLLHYYTGPSAAYKGFAETNGAVAVAIAITKKPGSNSFAVVQSVLDHVEKLKGSIIPDNLQIAVRSNTDRLQASRSVISVRIVLPDGSSNAATKQAVSILAQKLLTIYEVTDVRSYTGKSSPFNFSALVRQKFGRTEPWRGELEIGLLDEQQRQHSSPSIAAQIRALLKPFAKELKARIEVIATPIPTALRTRQVMIAQISAGDDMRRTKGARDFETYLKRASGVVSIAGSVEDPYDRLVFEVDEDKARFLGITVGEITRQLSMVMGGFNLSQIKTGFELEPRFVILQAPLSVRMEPRALLQMPVFTRAAKMVPLYALGRFKRQPAQAVIFRKDQQRVEVVTAELSDSGISGVDGMQKVNKLLEDYKAPVGVRLKGAIWQNSSTDAPKADSRSNSLLYLIFAGLLVLVMTIMRGRGKTAHRVQRFLFRTFKKAVAHIEKFKTAYALGARPAQVENHDELELPQTEVLSGRGRRDDLKKIKGIGPMIEQVLNAYGYISFEQVATLADGDIQTLELELAKNNKGSIGRIKRDRWREQARRLMFGESPFADTRSIKARKSIKQHTESYPQYNKFDRDDLRQIKGIGRVIEKILIKQGIVRFEQIAGLTPQEIDRIGFELDKKPRLGRGRIDRDNWILQAKEIVTQHSAVL